MKKIQITTLIISCTLLMFTYTNCSKGKSFRSTSRLSSATGELPTGDGNVSLAWDANSESDLTGYRIYYGISPDQLVGHIDVGLTTSPNAPSAIVSSLVKFGIYYFAVKAYNSSGMESTFSNVVSAKAE